MAGQKPARCQRVRRVPCLFVLGAWLQRRLAELFGQGPEIFAQPHVILGQIQKAETQMALAWFNMV